MSYREKSAWALLILLTFAAGFYAWEVGGAWIVGGEVPRPSFKLAAVYIAIVVIGVIISEGSLAAINEAEYDLPADERERAVINKAGNWSGYILGFGVIAGVIHYYQHDDGRLMFHIIVGSFMISQIVEYALQIWFFRRGV